MLEQSIPATADWQRQLLNDGVNAWGDFQWRYDIAPAASANDTDALPPIRIFANCLSDSRAIIRKAESMRVMEEDAGSAMTSRAWRNLANTPMEASVHIAPTTLRCSFRPTNFITWLISITPITTRRLTAHILAMDPTWYRDPGDGPDVESIRKDWEIYHYLVAQGVAGRWSHVFRPKVDHDDAIWYFQRMNRDSSKGVILTKHAKARLHLFRDQPPGKAFARFGRPIPRRRGRDEHGDDNLRRQS